ncbi:hypothetical protein DPMN_056501 [Dreissena polymorpha]|uniref:Uncharacterized protein n=1 Tax=Dreissena polymorpha TaxID=45954 RepID=A0A9D4HTJ8_DREPO|nr:hypothetical protein DPMN_056501 [Dreissena polymorpha]
MSPPNSLRMQIGNNHIRDNEREMQTNHSPHHSDASVKVGVHSPPRLGRSNADSRIPFEEFMEFRLRRWT